MSDQRHADGSRGMCVSLCNTTTSVFPQEFKLCSNGSTGTCGSLKFHGVLGHSLATNVCVSANDLFGCGLAPDPRQDRIAFDAMYVIAYVMTWALGVVALFGNLLTMSNSLVVLYRELGGMPKVKKLHNILLLNLGSADFLMGLFLLSHMVLYSKLGTPLLSRDYQLWKAGDACTLIGITGFVSSQVSVTTLVLITTCRLYSVIWPYKIIQIKPVLATAVLSWLAWTAVACVPLMGSADTFHNSMYVVDECVGMPFTATYGQLVALVGPMLERVNCTHLLPKFRSWSVVFEVVSDIGLFDRAELRTYPYYSDTNFCSPNYFNTERNPALGFLLLIIFFNLTAFTYMACAYCLILRRTLNFEGCAGAEWCRGVWGCFGAAAGGENRRDQENRAMYRRIFLVVLTDFACWVPISFISIARIANEGALSKYMTFYMIGFLLPVNSALNPFLYTNRWKHMLAKLCGRASPSKQDSMPDMSETNTNKTTNFVTLNPL